MLLSLCFLIFSIFCVETLDIPGDIMELQPKNGSAFDFEATSVVQHPLQQEAHVST